ncbi:MAG: hypothetical protein OXH52_09140 [Gammaproteobacteria bacterium]|nr:hypothetical protein [Gammaproteobacteria bacterium]
MRVHRRIEFIGDNSAHGTLEDAGFGALATSNSSDLAHILNAEWTRLVILDLVLPRNDGVERM